MSLFPSEGLTFDDVTLCTRYADFLPEEASTASLFSKNIQLKVPFVSAAMDTVTEHAMATSMAMEGGIGVIHKNLNPDKQAAEVRMVKGYLNGLINNPVTFGPKLTVDEILQIKAEKNYIFTGFPIVDEESKLCGIFTAKDLKFISDTNVAVEEIMTKKLISADVSCSVQEAHKIMIKERIGKLPLVDADGRLAGLYSFHDVSSLISGDDDSINRDDEYRLRVAAAIGPYDYERVEKLVNAGVDALVVDTAHGHSKGVLETVKELKKKYAIDIIAGNIATTEAAVALVKAGADAIKVGIGPGSICTTRVVCGVGVPQLTAVYNVFKGTKGDVPIIADGGIKYSGDVPKALAVGANSTMMGSVLAGTKESPGEKILHHGRTYVVYRGMGSVEAMQSAQGSRERYSHADVDDVSKLVPQGIEGLVELRGSVSHILNQFVGGLRFSLGYCGARTINELRKQAIFYRVSSAGLRESHPHDVKIYKDAPNYSTGE
ncbi:MAG: IMP dehydrogenase [Lentisphaeria bacterium]|nr:IMP dehydrogenase [Lentisphaeria bacterium]